jgi:hypothetical protein
MTWKRKDTSYLKRTHEQHLDAAHLSLRIARHLHGRKDNKRIVKKIERLEAEVRFWTPIVEKRRRIEAEERRIEAEEAAKKAKKAASYECCRILASVCVQSWGQSSEINIRIGLLMNSAVMKEFLDGEE